MRQMQGWPNGLVWYNEDDLRIRDFLIGEISSRLRSSFRGLNKAIDFIRVETPCMVPAGAVEAHLATGFPLWGMSPTSQMETATQEPSPGDSKRHTERLHPPVPDPNPETALCLRPETTRGSLMVLPMLFPQQSNLEKNLPVCVWQHGLSFRVEQDKSFGNLRFKTFYQMEFQLVYAEGTKADYYGSAVRFCREILAFIFPAIGISVVDLKGSNDLPFYSAATSDLYLKQSSGNSHEVIAVSQRTDFDYPVVEISCGLDRLTHLFQAI